MEPTEYELQDPDSMPNVEVAMEANILSVNDFDDSFKVSVLLHTMFKDPSVKKEGAVDHFFTTRSYRGFIPQITIINTIASQSVAYKYIHKINEATGDVWVSMLNTFCLGETLEFRKFPFDRQLFRIRMSSENCKLGPWRHDPALLNFGEKVSSLNADAESASFIVNGAFKQWELHGITVSYNPAAVNILSLNEPVISVNIKAERKPTYYFFNYVFIVYIIGAANVVQISVDPDTNFARNSITVSLLLAMVSFKYVILKDTPRVNYITYFDIYTRLAFVFLILAFLVNIVFSTRFLCQCIGLSSEDGCDQQTLFNRFEADFVNIEFYVQIGIWTIWSVFHLVILFVVLKPSLIMPSWKTLYARQKRLVRTPYHLTKFVYNEVTN